MKKCKKIVLLCIIFLLSVTLNVNAADYANTPTGATTEIVLTPSATEVKVGDTIKITVLAKCEKGIEGVDATLEYDKTKLQFTNSENLATTGFISMSGLDESTDTFKVSVLYSGQGAAPKETDIAVLSFKVLESATVNEKLSVKLSEIEIGDSNDEWTNILDKEVVIAVTQEQKPDNGEEKPDGGEEKPDGGEEKPEGGEEKPEGGEEKPDGGEEKPEDGEEKPDGGEEKPEGGEENSEKEETKEPTIADKPIDYAGSNTYSILGIVAIAIIAIVLYIKSKKYNDI